MMEKIKKFWVKHKDTIKNVTIAVAVPVAVVSLLGVRELKQVLEEKELNELYYDGQEDVLEIEGEIREEVV